MNRVPIQALLDYLQVAGGILGLYLAEFREFIASHALDVNLLAAKLTGLNQVQKGAKANRPPVTSQAMRALRRAMGMAKAFLRIARSYYREHAVDLVDSVPKAPARATEEAKLAFLDMVLAFFKEHREIDGIDLAPFQLKVAEVKALHVAAVDAGLVKEEATHDLITADIQSMDEAEGWMEMFRGFAKVIRDEKLLKTIPTVPHGRRRSARESNGTPNGTVVHPSGEAPAPNGSNEAHEKNSASAPTAAQPPVTPVSKG